MNGKKDKERSGIEKEVEGRSGNGKKGKGEKLKWERREKGELELRKKDEERSRIGKDG